MPMIMKFHQKQRLIQRSLPLDVSGRILLRRHIVPSPSNSAFRGWRETQDLSTPIFSRTQHAILHWKKAKSRSFVPMAQGGVRMSQWPLFKWKFHQSRMGSISLKIEEGTFIGAQGMTPSRRSIISALQWRTRKRKPICRWTIFSNYSSVQKITLFRSGTSHMMLMVTSS